MQLELDGMRGSVNDPSPFYPPRVKPAAGRSGFLSISSSCCGNNLEVIPEQAYREPIVVAPGPPRMAFFTGPEPVKTLLLSRHSEFPKGRVQVDVLKPIFGNAMLSIRRAGVAMAEKRSRAALFRHEELLQYGPIMSAAAEAIVAKWRAAPPGTVHPIHRDMMEAAFRVISQTMLAGGAEDMLDAIEKGHADYYSGVNWWVMYTMLRIAPLAAATGGKSVRAHEARLRSVVAELVRTRRTGAAAGEDLLARMLRASDPETGRSMSDELLVDNILSFLMAGYDTTAFSLTWTLYLISQSPEWEARMLDEIESVVGPVR